MPTNIAAPDRAVLRALFDQAVAELKPTRRDIDLTTGFYAKTGDAVFDKGFAALLDTASGAHRMHTVSAPAGGGKTTFAYAFIVALTRYAEGRSDAPYAAVFLVDQIKKADVVYRDLEALLPGKVAIWTKDHDRKCKHPEKVKDPAARFAPEELRHYPVAVVTHEFYLGKRGRNAAVAERNGLRPRALTVVDERPNEAREHGVTLWQAQKVREALTADRPETKEHMDALLRFMEGYSYVDPNKLYRPGLEIDAEKLCKELAWFRTSTAENVARTLVPSVPDIAALFAYAEALAEGCAAVATSGGMAHFFGYEQRLIIHRSAGTILLDATADIDGISRIVPWRVQATEIPKARYDNLEIIHVKQHTKKNLSSYLKTAANQRAYMAWVVETIKENMRPGEKGLVVVKKVLFDHEQIPTWPTADARFKDPKIYTEDFGWNLDGRELCAIHWGTGVGSNKWRDAAVVFLFDEFFIPRSTAVATTQGYRGHKAHEGDLGSMKNLNSKATGVDLIADGHTLRWTAQLAIRGHARVYDVHGVCGKQRLVVGSDLQRFMANVELLFPGAPPAKIVGDHTSWKDKILAVLNRSPADIMTTKELSTVLERAWRKVSWNLITPEFLAVLEGQGWLYVSKKGRGGSRFERIGTQRGERMLKADRDLRGSEEAVIQAL